MKRSFRGMPFVVTICIYLYLLLGIGVVIFLPRIANYFYATLSLSQIPYPIFLVFLYICCAAAIWLLVEFWFIMLRIRQHRPFIRQNANSLLRIGICCGVASIDMLFIQFFRFTPTLLVCALILLFGLLCAMVFSNLFRQAIQYKEENDLTI